MSQAISEKRSSNDLPTVIRANAKSIDLDSTPHKQRTASQFRVVEDQVTFRTDKSKSPYQQTETSDGSLRKNSILITQTE